MLEEFWAVTETSLYRVRAKDGSNLYPTAVKVALRGSSKLPVGAKLEGGTIIAVYTFLLPFFPERHGLSNPLTGPDEREPARVKMYRGTRTPPIVALFLNEGDARNCFAQTDPQPRDPRWLKETKEVLEAIGDDHPAFVISHSDPTKGMALISEKVSP